MPRKNWNLGRRTGEGNRKMTFGCWNVQGISTKLNILPTELDRFKMDVVILSETKRKAKGEEELGNYVHIWSGVSKSVRAKAGVSIMINKTWKKRITNWEFINERIIKVEMTLFAREVVIIGVYAPTNDTRDQEKDTFWTILRETIEKIPRRKELIIMGDMNGRVGIRESCTIVGKYGETEYNDNGERLIEICEQFDLKITNTFFKHKDIHKYTWQQNTRELRSIIDYIIIRQTSSFKATDVRSYRGAQCGSDHYLVKMKSFWPWKNAKNETNNTKMNGAEKTQNPHVNVEGLQDESIRAFFATRMEGTLDESVEGSTEEIYEYIRTNVINIATQVLGLRGNNHSRTAEWWSEEIEVAIIEKRKAFNQWLNDKLEATRTIYKEKKNEVMKKIRTAKNEAWERTCANVNSQLGFGRAKEAWSVVKGLRQETKAKTNLQLITPMEWEEYFQKLLNEDREEYLEEGTVGGQEQEGNEIQISESEVSGMLRTGKNGKSPGPGSINLELLKYGGDKIVKLITRLFNKILHGDSIPKEMKQGYINTIFKKGDRKSCSNYRGICVINTLMKLLGKILKNKLEQNFKTQGEQCGFTAGRSCVDHIFTLRQILEKQREKSKNIGLIFIDLEKAYDTVPRKLLWKALHMANIQGHLIRIIQEMYKDNICQVKIGNTLSKKFRTSKGLLQGCPMSPTLFKIYIDSCLSAWSRKCNGMGLEIKDGVYLHHLLFADDQVVIAQDGEDANYICNHLAMEYRKWGLKINYQKTEYLTNDPDDLYIEGKRIKKVNTFCYLGSILEMEGKSEVEINKRISSGRKVIGMLNSILWSKSIINRTKKIIYKSILESIVMYGVETCTVNLKHIKKLQAVEMDFWRRSARISRKDKIRNDEIIKRMGVKERILDVLERRKLQWYGHVRRMEEDRIPKMILEWEPEGKKRRGRPMTTWLQNVQSIMRRLGAEEEDTQDRNTWRNIIMK